MIRTRYLALAIAASIEIAWAQTAPPAASPRPPSLAASRNTARSVPPTPSPPGSPPPGSSPPVVIAPSKGITSTGPAVVPTGGMASPSPRKVESSGRRKASLFDTVGCDACHNTVAWKSVDKATGDAKFDHASTGFPLTGEHMHAPCVACHNSARTTKRACVSCHDDAHHGRLSQSCDTCHSSVAWRMTRPLEIHRLTRFPLTGMHALADCSECHRRASEHRWTDAPADCFACHEKDYRRPDLRPVHTGSGASAPFPRDCSMCHRSLAWAPATSPALSPVGMTQAPLVAPGRHDLRFPISFGIHRTATCDDCHTSMAVPRAVRCIGCHAHEPTRLMQQHRQPIGTDGSSCLTCHPGGARR